MLPIPLPHTPHPEGVKDPLSASGSSAACGEGWREGKKDTLQDRREVKAGGKWRGENTEVLSAALEGAGNRRGPVTPSSPILHGEDEEEASLRSCQVTTPHSLRGELLT